MNYKSFSQLVAFANAFNRDMRNNASRVVNYAPSIAYNGFNELLKQAVNYNGQYDVSKSILPGYDMAWQYLDAQKRQADYTKNTGRTMAYGSDNYSFASLGNFAENMADASRKTVYQVGRLSRWF